MRVNWVLQKVPWPSRFQDKLKKRKKNKSVAKGCNYCSCSLLSAPDLWRRSSTAGHWVRVVASKRERSFISEGQKGVNKVKLVFVC